MSGYLNKKEYCCVDLFKFIFSIFIVFIHTDPLEDYKHIKTLFTIRYYIKNGLCRIAVPFFFICTGFLLFKKIRWESNDNEPIKKYLLKLFKLLGIWFFISFYLSKVVLWYLVAVITSLLIIVLLRKLKVSFKVSFILSSILYVIGYVFESYYYIVCNLLNNNILKYILFIYEYFSDTTRNGLFFGLFFVMLGINFSRKEIIIKKPILFTGIILSILMLIIEIYFIIGLKCAKDYNLYLSLVLIEFFLFYLAISLELKNSYQKFRVYSTIIFFSHAPIYEILVFLNIMISKLLPVNFGSVFYSMTCLIASLLLSVFIEKESKKYNWIQNLYS